MRTWLIICLAALPRAARAQTPEQVEQFFNGKATLVLPAPDAVPASRKLKYTIVKAYPHDHAAFTEGLFWRDGFLYESIGLEKKSQIRMVDLKSGTVLQSADSPDGVFGEGLAPVNGRLIQLTYTEGRAFVYDFKTFRLIGEFHYKGEGWGLTTDGRSLVMSDGSDTLTFRDPNTFAAQRRVRVTLDRQPVKNINELEFAKGSIWANVWKEDRILRIDPTTGRVTGFLDLTGMLRTEVPMPEPDEDVLNGIAYDPASGHFYVTGKCWPLLFELKIED